MLENDTLVFSSEKNSYIRDDLAQNWPQFKAKLAGIAKDNKGRSIVDVRFMFGEGRLRSRSVLTSVVLLTRDTSKPPFTKLSVKDALSFITKNDFCNPHQLVRTKEKQEERKQFFAELFKRVPIYLLNTIETPKESLERVKALLGD